MRLRRTILIAIGLTLTLPPLAGGAAATDVKAAAQQTAHESTAPTIQVYSRETIVDVTVTDARGQPVHGLKQSDFTIAENGKPQPIRSFKEFGADPPAPTHALPRLPPGVYTNFQAAPTNGPVNILLIDALNSNYTLVDYAQKAILRYLQTIPPGTQVAVFWLSESGLHLLQGFTSDAPTLLRAVNTNRTDIGSNLEKYTRDWYTIDAFKQLSQYVAGVKGRKNLLWFTPGMPIDLMRDGGYSWGKAHGIDMSEVHHIMDAYELLSAEQVAVYPVDPSGVHPFSVAQLRAEQVAEQSGGLALYNNNDIASLITKAIDHGAHFYTLSYVPPSRTEDGRFHHIAITVNRPGLHLIYRKGYNAEDPPVHIPNPGAPLMKAAMEGVAPAATQLLFDAQVDAAPATKPAVPGKTSVRFNILYLLPQSQIAFANGPDGTHNGSLEFDAIAYDDMRKRVALVSQTMKLPLTAEEYQQFTKTPFKFSQQLDLPPGQVTLRVGILDSVSNKVGTLEIPLLVSPTSAQQNGISTYNVTPCPPRCALPKLPAVTPAPR
jgi:VWFA-related protein